MGILNEYLPAFQFWRIASSRRPPPFSNSLTRGISSSSHVWLPKSFLPKAHAKPVTCGGALWPTKWNTYSLAWNLRASVVICSSLPFQSFFPLPHAPIKRNYSMLLKCAHIPPPCLCPWQPSSAWNAFLFVCLPSLMPSSVSLPTPPFV